MTDEFLEFKHRSGITISIPRGLKREERDQALADAKVYVSIRLWDLDQQNEIDSKQLSSTDPYYERLSDKVFFPKMVQPKEFMDKRTP